MKSERVMQDSKLFDSPSVTFEELFGSVSANWSSMQSILTKLHQNVTGSNGSWRDVAEQYGNESKASGYEDAEFVLTRVVIPVVACFGLLGTCFTLAVLCLKSNKTSTNSYVMALACGDMFYILTVLADWSLWFYYTKGKYLEDADLDIVALSELFISTWLVQIGMAWGMMMATWLTVIISLERYIAICHPMQAGRQCTICKSRTAVLIIISGTLLLQIPKFFTYTLEWRKDSYGTRYLQATSNKHVNLEQLNLVTGWVVEGCLVVIVPFLVLIFANTSIIVRLYRSHASMSRNLPQGSRSREVLSHEQKQVTVMLVLVVAAFFLCSFPHGTYIIMTSLDMSLKRTSRHSYFLLKNIARIMILVKASINFLLYCWFSERFRATLRRFWGVCASFLCPIKCSCGVRKGQLTIKAHRRHWSPPSRSTSSRSTFV